MITYRKMSTASNFPTSIRYPKGNMIIIASTYSKKYILSKLNEEMKLNFSKFIQHYQIKVKDRNYFKEYLSDISEELISISHKKKGISRLNFIKYFNLPGMISLRLFSAFNTNKCDEDSPEKTDEMLKSFEG